MLAFSGRLLGIDAGRAIVDEGAGSKSGAIKSYQLVRFSPAVPVKPSVWIDGEPVLAEGRLYHSVKPESASQSPSAVSVSATGSDEVVYPNAKWIGAAAKNRAYSDANRYRYWSGVSRVYLGSQMSADAQGKWAYRQYRCHRCRNREGSDVVGETAGRCAAAGYPLGGRFPA